MRLGLKTALPVLFIVCSAQAADDQRFIERPLDGVNIEAVETYRNPKPNSLDVGLGIWPLKPYYNGLSVDVGYNWILGKTYTFELRGS